MAITLDGDSLLTDNYFYCWKPEAVTKPMNIMGHCYYNNERTQVSHL